MRDTERLTDLHEEEEREEGDRGEKEERKGDSRGERSTLLSVSKVFSITQIPTKIHRIGLGREGERSK